MYAEAMSATVSVLMDRRTIHMRVEMVVYVSGDIGNVLCGQS